MTGCETAVIPVLQRTVSNEDIIGSLQHYSSFQQITILTHFRPFGSQKKHCLCDLFTSQMKLIGVFIHWKDQVARVVCPLLISSPTSVILFTQITNYTVSQLNVFYTHACAWCLCKRNKVEMSLIWRLLQILLGVRESILGASDCWFARSSTVVRYATKL